MIEFALLPLDPFWDDNGINVQFVTSVSRKVIVPEDLIIEIENRRGGKISIPVTLQPRTFSRFFSGYDYLEGNFGSTLDDRTNSSYYLDILPDNQGSLLRAFHDPSCRGVWSSGGGDTDWFFRNKKLPEGVLLVNYIVSLINPEDPNGSWNVALNNFTNLCISALTQNYFNLFTNFAQGLIGSFINTLFPDAGRYGISIVKKPDKNDRSLGVRWDTTCYFGSSMDDVTLIYIAGFLVEWPEDLPYKESGTPTPTDPCPGQTRKDCQMMDNPYYW